MWNVKEVSGENIILYIKIRLYLRIRCITHRSSNNYSELVAIYMTDKRKGGLRSFLRKLITETWFAVYATRSREAIKRICLFKKQVIE